jgi:hypothetical protein
VLVHFGLSQARKTREVWKSQKNFFSRAIYCRFLALKKHFSIISISSSQMHSRYSFADARQAKKNFIDKQNKGLVVVHGTTAFAVSRSVRRRILDQAVQTCSTSKKLVDAREKFSLM